MKDEDLTQRRGDRIVKAERMYRLEHESVKIHSLQSDLWIAARLRHVWRDVLSCEARKGRLRSVSQSPDTQELTLFYKHQ